MGAGKDAHKDAPVVVIVMGVSGSGKTTVGKLLADECDWPYYDADAFHSAENIAKMKGGVPLTDEDRKLWLEKLRELIEALLREGKSAVLACSALKEAYRGELLVGHPQVRLVYLKGSYYLIKRRLERRHGHYFKARMLQSQFADLEEPSQAMTIRIDKTPVELASDIRDRLQGESSRS